jgi:hypothetical protein
MEMQQEKVHRKFRYKGTEHTENTEENKFLAEQSGTKWNN